MESGRRVLEEPHRVGASLYACFIVRTEPGTGATRGGATSEQLDETAPLRGEEPAPAGRIQATSPGPRLTLIGPDGSSSRLAGSASPGGHHRAGADIENSGSPMMDLRGRRAGILARAACCVRLLATATPAPTMAQPAPADRGARCRPAHDEVPGRRLSTGERPDMDIAPARGRAACAGPCSAARRAGCDYARAAPGPAPSDGPITPKRRTGAVVSRATTRRDHLRRTARPSASPLRHCARPPSMRVASVGRGVWSYPGPRARARGGTAPRLRIGLRTAEGDALQHASSRGGVGAFVHDKRGHRRLRRRLHAGHRRAGGRCGAGHEEARRLSGSRAGRIGYQAGSQGGWVAPLAASARWTSLS